MGLAAWLLGPALPNDSSKVLYFYVFLRSLGEIGVPAMKFFQLKITLGLALGESWPLLAQPQKNTDVYKGLNHLRQKQGCKLMDQI